MKKLTFLVIVCMLFSLLISSLAFAEMVEIKVGKGTLKIGGILQAGFTYHMEDKEGYDSFTLNRARFLFWGTIVPDKVKYFVQLEHKGSVSVLDYKARFFYIPQTEITVGRFLPNFTLYMPYSTAQLEMINYPITTTKFAMWRQVGIQTTTKTDYFDFNLGVFNGSDIPNNTSDNNDAKDFLVRGEIKPPIDEAKVRFGGYAWIGNAEPPSYVLNPDEKTLKMNRFGGFARVDYKAADNFTVKFRGEFLTASTENLFFTHVDSVATTDAQSFFAHVGIQPSPNVEFLARYDFHDPNTDMSYKEGVSDDDEETWLTAGVNYYLEGINAMFYLNYIRKMEPGDMNTWDDDAEKWVKKEREVDNDLVKAQVQITF